MSNSKVTLGSKVVRSDLDVHPSYLVAGTVVGYKGSKLVVKFPGSNLAVTLPVKSVELF